MSVSDLYSYEKDGVVVRPLAADYMKKELQECLEEEKNDDYDNRGVVYEIKEVVKLS